MKNPCFKFYKNVMALFLIGLSTLTFSACTQSEPNETDKSTVPGQSLGLASVPNLRDLGGYKTTDGATVASGLVYRANKLCEISPDDMGKLGNLKLKAVYDLRTTKEREECPDELPPGANYIVMDVLADYSPWEGQSERIAELMQNPKAANAELGGGKLEAGSQELYRLFVSLPGAQREFRKLFLAIADKNQLPAVFHCSAGKDRTGWAAASFLTLLGVPKDQVFEDYLRSNDYMLPAYKNYIDAFVADGGDPEIIRAILGVKKEYLEAAFDEMQTRYGTIEKYFSDGLGITADEQKAIRNLYLEKK